MSRANAFSTFPCDAAGYIWHVLKLWHLDLHFVFVRLKHNLQQHALVLRDPSKSPMLCLHFISSTFSTRHLFCRWRRGVAHQVLDQSFLELPPPASSSLSPSAEPCLHQDAATYPAPFVITLGALNLMPPRIRRSLILPRRPSILPRLPLKMAAHSPPLSKRWACRGKRGRNSHGTGGGSENTVISLCAG